MMRPLAILALAAILAGCAPVELPAERTGRDGSTMVLVPAGRFQMGFTTRQADASHAPFSDLFQGNRALHGMDRSWFDTAEAREVELPAFYIDRHEVTNARFRRFVDQTGYLTRAERLGHSWVWSEEKKSWDPVPGADWRHPRGAGSDIEGKDDHPVVQVAYEDAEAYARWAGKRLPSEPEWEKAARGTDGRLFPWGNDWKWAANNVSEGTAPVGSSPGDASPFGVMDMAGNAAEWTTGWNSGRPDRPYEGPPELAGEQFHKVRGATWDCVPINLNCACVLTTPVAYTYFIGFRCAQDP